MVPPGVDARFTPGGRRSPHPLVAAVGRLVPVKRFDVLIDGLVELRRRHPTLEAVIAGEGYRARRPRRRRSRPPAPPAGCICPGRLDDAELVDLYRRAWVVASTSVREGWGMTLTEAAACGTPAVATAIPGHADAVRHGVSGLLADDGRGLVAGARRGALRPGAPAPAGPGRARRAASLDLGGHRPLGTLAALAAEALYVRRCATRLPRWGLRRRPCGWPATSRSEAPAAGGSTGDRPRSAPRWERLARSIAVFPSSWRPSPTSRCC